MQIQPNANISRVYGFGGLPAVASARPIKDGSSREPTDIYEAIKDTWLQKSSFSEQGFAPYGADGLLRGKTRASAAGPEADSPEAKAALEKLKNRDREVRAKAQAQGEAVGGRRYAYQTGPDGKQYAIGSSAVIRREGNESAAQAEAGDPAGAIFAVARDGGPEDAALRRRLEARDQEVRLHEKSHQNAAGGLASAIPEYDRQVGPDGRGYAIGGSVDISLKSDPADPESAKKNAATVERAALAPGSPSGQDFNAAAQAAHMRSMAEARERQNAALAYQRQDAASSGAGRLDVLL